MRRHETPNDLAVSLARHAPRRIHSLLDPAVGTGNLIAPLLSRLKRNGAKVCCIDTDAEAIESVSTRFHKRLPPNTKLVQSDFLSWSLRPRTQRFDCIVMNPPFGATKTSLHQMVWNDPSCPGEFRTRHLPLEAAFVYRAIELLEKRGRLLAVLPCSLPTSDSLKWLREEMLSVGAVRFVHELPPRTFPGVESRMYLLVFDKGVKNSRIELLNHDLHEPERLSLVLSEDSGPRLDFGYVNACKTIARLQEIGWLKWSKLGDLADVIRGDIESPLGPTCAIHSTDFCDGFWKASQRHSREVVRSDARRVRRGDILMLRVGRNACRSAGKGIGLQGMSCSDCVLIVRPKKVGMSLRVLFALKAILSNTWARPLVERGTGATYIGSNNLLDLPIPMGVCDRYPLQFHRFAAAEKSHSSCRSLAVVNNVAQRLNGLLE